MNPVRQSLLFPPRAAVAALTLILTLHGLRPSQAAELKLGAAAVSINPPAGIGMAGYYHERGHDGVLDDIMVKAAVLDDGHTRAAIVVCDLISMPKWIVTGARRLVEERTGMPGANVMIAATHTHTAPVLLSEWNADEPGGGGTKTVTESYNQSLPGWIADAVAAAHERRRAVRVSVAKEREPQPAHNRRFWMRDGSVSWNPGKGDARILRPAGPVDPEVGVLYAETAAEPPAPVLTFVNYALHPDTTGGTRLSADFPGALARTLALYKGPDMLTLFANGTCGNINHRDVLWLNPQSGPREADRIGAILGAAVFRAWPRLQPLANPGALRVRSETVRLPRPAVTAEQLEAARHDVRTVKDSMPGGFMKLVRAYRVLDIAAARGEPQEVEMQVITLGREVAWVSWPGEIFVELGLSVKAGSPFPHTYNVELANGAIGYVPDRPAYAEGAYEVESARVAAGAGEMLVTSALRMLAAMFEEAKTP